MDRILEEVIRQAMAAGEFRADEAALAAIRFLRACIRSCDPRLMVECAHDPEPATDQMVDFCLAALAKEPLCPISLSTAAAALIGGTSPAPRYPVSLRHSRRLGWRAPVSGRQFPAFRSVRGGFRAPVSARHFSISISADGMTCSQFRRHLCAMAGYFLPHGPASNSSSA